MNLIAEATTYADAAMALAVTMGPLLGFAAVIWASNK